MSFLRAWISVDGETLDDPALPSSVFFDEAAGTVRIGFPSSAEEVDKIARGRLPTIRRNFELNVIFKSKPRSRIGKLEQYSFSQKKENNPAKAWIESGSPSRPEVFPLQVVDAISGDNQVVIKSDEKIEVASNLVGQLIWVQMDVLVNKSVQTPLDAPKVEEFQAHLITDQQVYITVPVKLIPRLPSNDGVRWIEGKFNPDEIKRTPLK